MPYRMTPQFLTERNLLELAGLTLGIRTSILRTHRLARDELLWYEMKYRLNQMKYGLDQLKYTKVYNTDCIK